MAESLGASIRQRRGDVGLSQVELAELAGVHRGTIRNAEQGRPLEARTIANLLRVLGCAPALSGAALPVLSSGVVRAIVHSLLRLPPDQRTTATTDYLDAVGAVASGHDPDATDLVERLSQALTDLADAPMRHPRGARGPRINANALRGLRLEAGLTQTELATRAGVAHSHVSRLEKQVRTHPTPRIVAGLARALGVEVRDLLDGDGAEGVRQPQAEPPQSEDMASTRTELLALDVMVAAMERLDGGERRRALAYLADRYGDTMAVGS